MPKITDITEQKRNKSRLNIFIDEKFETGASKYSIKRNGIKVGMEITPEKLKQVVRDDEVEKAKGYIIDYHLNKSKKIVQDKLIEKGYEEEVIKEVMTFIDKYNLINDREYAKKYIHDAIHIKKYGERKIAQVLKQNGINEKVISEELDDIANESQIEIAEKELSKKLDRYKRKSEHKYELRQKCYAFLARRGYHAEIINIVLESLENELNMED